MSIPKRLGQIWIGPLTPPYKWMRTWKEKNPEWDYILYGNDVLHKYKFRTHKQIDELLMRGSYNGVADLMRYELLYEYGGFIAEADSICLKNISALFKEEKAYTVYENEFIRGKLVSPILASEPQNKFLGELIDKVVSIDPKELRTPWKDTGNLFCALMIKEKNPDIEIFPSHLFNPSHYTGLESSRYNEAYAIQMWGSTGTKYVSKNIITYFREKVKKRYRKKAERHAERVYLERHS